MNNANRLTYTSDKAFFRSLQMSRNTLFIFIEGKYDRYFYDKLCKNHLSLSNITYELRIAAELPGGQGGKYRLIKYFIYLQRNNYLENVFNKKKTISLFLVDKDIDDILNKYILSNHFVYTKHYSVENYFFLNSNLVESIASSTSIEYRLLQAHLSKSNIQWCKAAAEAWKDWVKFCVFSRYRNVNCICNYGVTSKLQNSPYEKIDAAEYNKYLNELKIRSKLTEIGFKRVFNRISRIVDELYEANEHNIVFNGKWYIYFLIEDIKTLAGNQSYINSSLHDRLSTSLQLTLNARHSWSSRYSSVFKKLNSNL